MTFGPSTAKAFWKWLKVRGPDDGPLFTNVRGNGRLTANGLSQLLARIKAKSGVQVRPHMFRHTRAHLNLANGMNEHDIANPAGWSSIRMLERYRGAARCMKSSTRRGCGAVQERPEMIYFARSATLGRVKDRLQVQCSRRPPRYCR